MEIGPKLIYEDWCIRWVSEQLKERMSSVVLSAAGCLVYWLVSTKPGLLWYRAGWGHSCTISFSGFLSHSVRQPVRCFNTANFWLAATFPLERFLHPTWILTSVRLQCQFNHSVAIQFVTQHEFSWPILCLSAFPLLCCRPTGSSAHALAKFWLWNLCGNLGLAGNAACWCHQNTHAAVPPKVPQDKPGLCLRLQGEVNPF